MGTFDLKLPSVNYIIENEHFTGRKCVQLFQGNALLRFNHVEFWISLTMMNRICYYKTN